MVSENTAVDLGYLSIQEASRQLADGSLTATALATALFDRIAVTDVVLNSYVRLMQESALREAAAADERARAGHRIGPLDGIPIAVKDLYDTAGVVTAGGTAAFNERVPAEDASTVRRLRAAGSVLLGKTNTHELALGGTTNNAYYGPTHNPWRLDRVPGGSSGGSGAALAGGQALGALGTDTGGSIRIPAAFCGVTGHKPTYGLVGRGGVMPLSLTLDHAGPMARTVEDCALMLGALAGPDARDFDSAMRDGEDYTAGLADGISGLRLALIPSLVEGCADDVRENFEQSLDVLRSLGATITACEPMAGYDDWRAATSALLVTEGAAYVESILRERPQSIAEPTRTRMSHGLEVSGTAFVRAFEARKRIESRFEATLVEQGIDAYLIPTSPNTAGPIDADRYTDAAPPTVFRNTGVFNLSHQPSLSVPNGFDREDLPTGLMISGARFADALVLRIGHAYQQATDFHTRRPIF